MEKINLKAAADAVESLFIYEKIGMFNGNVLTVVNVANRTLDVHSQEESDELFDVIEGQFYLETETERLLVSNGEMIIVPRGVKHRPVVEELTKFLMVELAGTLNKENSGDMYKA